MKRLLTAIMVFSVLAGMTMAMTKTTKVIITWVKPGETVYEFPHPKNSDYKTVLYYSAVDLFLSGYPEKAILEIRRVKIGYFSEDVPAGSWPKELKLQTGQKIIIGDTINRNNHPIYIEVLAKQMQGLIKLKIYS